MKKKITIGLFNDSFFPVTDGVALVVDNYARRLSKYANVVVFVPSYKGSFDDNKLPYKVVRCKSIKVPFLDYSLAIPIFDFKFRKIVKSYDFDIIHVHSPFAVGKVGIKHAKKHHIPCIATMHSQFKRDFYKAIKNEKIASFLTSKLIKQFNKCDECWAVNGEIARLYYEDYKYRCLPKVMNNATEMAPVQDKIKAREYIDKKYGIKKDEKVFLFVGRINTLKNIFFLVDSLKILKDMFSDLSFKMLFVGSGNEEDLLIKRIKSLGLTHECILCGKVMDRVEISYYYVKADLFLFPSLYDASSIVQIEAASQMTPTLFIEGSATSSTVTNDVNGFIAPNDKYQYAKRIYEIMNDDKFLKEVSHNAYRDLYRNWDDTIEEVYDRYVKIIYEYKGEEK